MSFLEIVDDHCDDPQDNDCYRWIPKTLRSKL